MRLLKILLPVMMLLMWSITALADYNPSSPPEPGTPKVAHDLILTSNMPGASNLYGAGAYTAGTRQRVYVSNIRTYYTFVNWTNEDGEVVSTSSDFYYVMPDKKVTLTANFTYNFTYNPSNPAEPGTPHVPRKLTLTSSHPGAATLYGAGTYNEGSSQRVYLTNVQNYYTFVNWTDDEGKVVSTSKDFYYVMPDRNVTLTANFTYDYIYNPSNPAEPGTPHVPRKLTLTSSHPGAASLYGAGTYNEGSSQRVYLTNIQNYYTFVNWTDDEGTVVSASRDFQYVMPNRNVTLTANFTYDYVYNPTSPAEPGTPNPDESVADNMVNFPRFGMYDDTHVMILCETPGATIYYTLDGTDPTANSSVYTRPVYVSGNILVKAVAMKEGMENSPIRSYQVMTYKTAAPKFTFVNKKIEITSDTEGAIIRYTLDNTDPNQTSTVYTNPIEPEDNRSIRAYASSQGLADSNISTYLHRIADYSMAAPTFALDKNGKLVITSAVKGSTIHYTTDGSTPTSQSSVYTGPITLNGNCTVKAFATHVNYYDSPVGEYVAKGFKVERPTFSFVNPRLTFSTTTTDAQIRYTMDGSIPTETSSLYTNSLQLNADCLVVARGFKKNYESSDTISFKYVYKDYQLPTPTASFANRQLTLRCADDKAQIHYTTDANAAKGAFKLYESPLALTSNCTVRFYASREHFNDSEIATYTFVKAEHQVTKPVISYNPDTRVVSITSATADAQIRYTTDGTVPTATSGNVYGKPFTVEGNATITAVAFRSDLFDSEPEKLVIDSQKVPTPTASFANRQLTLRCADDKAQIHYTTDANAAKNAFKLYESPLALTSNCTVRFYASREHFNDSEIATYAFVKAEHQVTKPVINYNPDTKVVSITSVTADAQVRYTTDGTVPTATTGNIYSKPFTVEGNATITAVAFRNDLFDSEPEKLVIDSQKVPTPTASFANRQLTLRCADDKAQIHYTTDANAAKNAFKLYESPFALTSNCTVRFYASREHFNDSEIATYTFVKAEHQVSKPVINYNPDTRVVSITSATADAQIRYTTDGTVPTATTGNIYSKPFTVEGNVTITAVAFRNDLFDSEPEKLVIDSQKVPTPTASFANRQLTLRCADDKAQIHYTTEANAAKNAFKLYESPLALTSNCTVRFYASREHFNDSEIATYAFVKAEHQVAKPKIEYDEVSSMVRITCDTKPATILYTIDDANVKNNGKEFTGAFQFDRNGTVRAIAIDPNGNLHDSEIDTKVIDWKKVATPAAKYAAHQLTLTCDDGQATIYYSTDDNAAETEFTRYENPLLLDADCNVRFLARREHFIDSETGSFEFVLADYKESNATISKDYKNRKVTVNSDDCTVRVTIDGIAEEYQTPATIDVTPDMESIRVVSLAGNADRYDSDPVEEKLVFHLPPVVSYDGHTISVSVADNDPAKPDAEVKANFNGIEFTGNHPADEMGSVSASVESDKAFLSDPTELPVDFFNTGKKAGARNGHSLSEAFAGWRSETGYPQLTIVGEIDREDLEFLAGIGELTTLSLNPDRMADVSYDSALEGSGIETIYLKEAPDGLLKGMPALTSVVWRNANAALTPAAFDSPMNPNILIWTANESLVTADTRNIVTSTGIGADPSAAMTGHADSISLTPGYPYNAHNPIDVDHIEFAKQFTQPTQPEVCRGWETIALPFTPGDIRHRDKGPVLPYAVWEENNADGGIDDNGPKPFWIYRATADDWQPAASIEAGMPYIISMPNNPDYIESYNLAGEIVFSAENVRIGDSDPDNGVWFPYVSDWVSGMSFHATFMPVEEEHLSLNSGWTAAIDGILPGSVFTTEAETLPFGAYVTGTAARFVPLFGGGNGISLTTLSGTGGIRVEVPGQNCLRLTSPRSCRVDIHTTTGALVRSVSLPPSESVTVTGLTPGIYLVAGRKVLIR